MLILSLFLLGIFFITCPEYVFPYMSGIAYMREIGFICLLFVLPLSLIAIPFSLKSKKKKIKFSKLLFVISATIIIIIFLVFIWNLIFPVPHRLVPDYIQLIDYSCANGTAQAIIRNAGTKSINIGASCSGAGTISATCGDIIITKTSGGNFISPTVTPTGTLALGQVMTFTEICGVGNTCTYRFTTTTGRGSLSPNVATVSC